MLAFHKKIFNDIEQKNCNLILNNDFGSCFVNESVTLNVLTNDYNLITPVITLGTLPNKGNAVINLNNSITYTASTAIEGDTDFFEYLVNDSGCISNAFVYIDILDALIRLPSYFVLNLNLNFSQGNACNISGNNAVVKYSDDTNFLFCTVLFEDSHGLHLSPYGYYTNGSFYRLWNGTSFVGSIINCSAL